MKNEKVSQLAKELYWIKRRITYYNNVLSELKYKLYLKKNKNLILLIGGVSNIVAICMMQILLILKIKFNLLD